MVTQKFKCQSSNDKAQMTKVFVGVLAIQGSFREHIDVVKSMGYKVIEVRHPEDLKDVTHFIMPGGESTTMAKLMKIYGLDDEIVKKVKEGMSVFATCAGMILLSKNISYSLNLTDIEVDRNAYGRQLDSFETTILDIDKDEFGFDKMEAVFIRAPRIKKIGLDTQVLASIEGDPVLVRENKIILASFHPELTSDRSVYEYFLKI
jgi:5'-phosphate synthase pdxT subunit